jgi:hypothetical protein
MAPPRRPSGSLDVRAPRSLHRFSTASRSTRPTPCRLGTGNYIEVFDAGEGGARGDAEPVGKHSDTDEPSPHPGCEHLELSSLDGSSELPDERERYGFAFPQNPSRNFRDSVSSSGVAGRTRSQGPTSTLKAAGGEPGGRLHGNVYLLVTDVEVGARSCEGNSVDPSA